MPFMAARLFRATLADPLLRVADIDSHKEVHESAAAMNLEPRRKRAESILMEMRPSHGEEY